jgi:hypothetical protein
MAFPFSNRNGAHHERGPRPPHRDEREVERRGMFSKRSSEWSVKSRSSLTWIDTPKTVEEEHGGPWYTVRYDNPPMVLNPLGNQ